MGANAVTSVYDFTAMQVLTAAQMDNVNCGIPVFATTTTRDAAFGGAGEKTLAEGQYAYIEASNATQFYDGSAWQTLGSTPGMVLVTAGSTSAAAALTLDNVFTSSYRNYKLFIDGVTSADDIDVPLKFRAGGATNSNSNYTRQSISAGASGVSRGITSNGTSFTSVVAGGTTRLVLEATFYAPQAAVNTGFLSSANTMSTNSYAYVTGGTFTAATQFDGFIMTPTSGTITVTYRLYGLAD
jgi:hypothetical protein